jgi:GNAT superfamily N-acetyltransferase
VFFKKAGAFFQTKIDPPKQQEQMTMIASLEIKTGYIPGAIGRITELHGTYYNRHWGFGLFFEAKVATELSEFLLRYDADRDGIWVATQNGRIEGAIVMDGIHAGTDGAHLRWFILSDALRGKGVGRTLVEKAMTFCRDRGYRKAHLWTFEGLDAARRLYEEAGFRLVRQKRGVQWGAEVNEQYMEINLG